MDQYTVTYEARPWTTNAERRLNRWKRAELVKEWRTAFHLLARAQRIPTQTQPIIITATVEQKGGVLQDVAACNPAVKAAIDGLVDAKIIPDDNSQWLPAIHFTSPQRSTRNALTLTISPADKRTP